MNKIKKPKFKFSLFATISAIVGFVDFFISPNFLTLKSKIYIILGSLFVLETIGLIIFIIDVNKFYKMYDEQFKKDNTKNQLKKIKNKVNNLEKNSLKWEVVDKW